MSTTRGVIFDIDGTLLDSNDAHARAWVDALADRGIDVTFEKVRPLIGMGGDKVLPRIAGTEEESAEGEALSKRRGEIFRTRYLPTLKAFPHTRELLETLRARGLRIAVATSASKEDLAALLEKAGVADLIEEHTSSDDAERSKPDPDIVEAALDRISLPKEAAVMIGDTPYDIEAAARAGIGAIAFRCGGGWRDDDFRGAIAIYDGPWDLLTQLDASPLAR